MVNGKVPPFAAVHSDPVEQATKEQQQELHFFKCWLSDWFLATRGDAKEYHCTRLGYHDQCNYCTAKEGHPEYNIIFEFK